MTEIYWIKEINLYIFKYKNNYYLENEDKDKIKWKKEKITKNYWKLLEYDTTILEENKEFSPVDFYYIELIFELENIESLVQKNKIKFINFDNPSHLNNCKKTKIYNIYTFFEKNILKLKFDQKEISLAIHLINKNLINIFNGNPLFSEKRNLEITKITYNDITYSEINIYKILKNKENKNLIKIEFNKNIEEYSDLLVIINDKYTYKPEISKFINI